MFPALAGRMRPSDPARTLNGMFSFTPDAGSIVGESADRPRRLGLRGGVGHARRRHGAPGRRVDGGRRAELRPGRGRREPLLPVPDDGALRARAREAAVPRGLRHPASAPAAGEAARPAAHAVPRAPRRARGRASSPAPGGSGRSGSRPTASWSAASPTSGRGAAAGPRASGRRSRAASTSPCASGRRSVRHHALREAAACTARTRSRSWSASAPTGWTGRSVRSIYTAMLTPRGGIRCDVTVIAPLDEDVVPAGRPAAGPACTTWRGSARRQRDDERVTHRRSARASRSRSGSWGPRARDIVQAVTDDDLSNDAFPYMTVAGDRRSARRPMLRPAHQLRRRARLGALRAGRDGRSALWDTLWEAGREHGLIAAGPRGVRLDAPGEGLPAVGPGHPHRVRPAVGRARVRGALGQGLPGQGGARSGSATRVRRSAWCR